MGSSSNNFEEYYNLYEKARNFEKLNKVDEALNIYLSILNNYEPCGIPYYERPAIILEKQKEYTRALEVCNLALNNPKRFNKPTWEGITDKFTKRKNRLLDKISKNNPTAKIQNKKVSSSKSAKNKTNTDIIPVNNDISKEIVYPDWYITISFGESKSQSFAQAVALVQMAPQFIINNVEGKKLYQAVYSDKPNEYLQFITLYELVSQWKSCFVILNGKVMDRKIIGKLNYCYGDKCRSGKSDFCYGASEITKNPFGCHRLQISSYNNPWTSFGQYDTSGVFHIDKSAIKNRIMNYSAPYLDCPCFSMDGILEALDKLPNKINKTNNYNSSYECEINLDELEERPISFIDKLKSLFKK